MLSDNTKSTKVLWRLRSALSAGWQEWRQGSGYQPRALISGDPLLWDQYAARLWRYSYSRHYYDNTIYSSLNKWASQLRKESGLYRHIRAVKNPTHRLVELYTAKTYGGIIDYTTGRGGAIPLMGDDELVQATLQLFRWSNWQLEKSLYVRNGANLGDTALKVVDDRERQKVYLEVLPADFIEEVHFDSRGNVQEIILAYEMAPPGESPYVMREVITKEYYLTLKGEEEFPYYNDREGNPVSKWPNEAGFVPVVVVNHTNVGKMWGASAMHGVWDKVDILNNLVSYALDQARKSITPLLLGRNMPAIEQKQLSDGRDDINILTTMDEKAAIEAISPNLNIRDAIELAKYIEEEIENDLPELSMHRLRQANQQTAPGVLAAFGDAIDRFEEAQGVYDDGLLRGIKMGISIGAMNRYQGFERFSLQDYDRGNLDGLYIGERPVVSDTLTRQQDSDYRLRRATLLAEREDKGKPLTQRHRILELLQMDGVEDAEAEIEAAIQEQEEQAVENSLSEAVRRLTGMTSEALGNRTTPPSTSSNGVDPALSAMAGQNQPDRPGAAQ